MFTELEAAKRAWDDAKKEYQDLRERSIDALRAEILAAVEYKMLLEKSELKKAMARHV